MVKVITGLGITCFNFQFCPGLGSLIMFILLTVIVLSLECDRSQIIIDGRWHEGEAVDLCLRRFIEGELVQSIWIVLTILK